MSNDIYQILNNFNKLIEQKSQPTEQKTVDKPKTQLQESIEQVNEKYMGFKKTVAAIKKGGSAENPEAVAAAIGRKKYGKEKFQKAAAAGKKLNEMDKSQPSSDRGGESSGNPYAKGGKAVPVKSKEMDKQALKTLNKSMDKAHKKDVKEEQQDESALQAYLGKKKYGEKGMKALQQAGREGASKEKMAKIRAQHDKMDESEQVTEKAVSKAQQKFMGMVHAAQKGGKAASPEVAKVAKGMSKKAAKDYASTKHKGLPQHVNEAIIRALKEGLTKEQIVQYLLKESDKEYWKDLMKDIPDKDTSTKTVHKGHYGTEYQGDDDEDDDGQSKKKIAKPAGEKRGRGRPKGVKNRVVRAGVKKAAAGSTEKRGRGRPAGSKNKALKESADFVIDKLFSRLVKEVQGTKLSEQTPPAQRPPLNIGARQPTQADLDKLRASGAMDEIMKSTDPNALNKALGYTGPVSTKPVVAPKDVAPADVKVPNVREEDADLEEMLRLAGMEETLHGKQHRLDVDKDGKIEKSDLAALRSGKSAVDEADMEEGNEFSGALDAARDAGEKEFEVDGRTYPVKETEYNVRNEPVEIRSRMQAKHMVPGRAEPKSDVKLTWSDAQRKANDDEIIQLQKSLGHSPSENDADKNKLDECGDMGPMANGMNAEQDGKMNVSTNMSSDGHKSVTVTADGSAAVELMQLLALAGMEKSTQMAQPEVKVMSMEEKDTRYEASTTPDEEVLPLETQLKGGDGEVAGKEKKMNPHGSARFSDNPLAVKESMTLKLIKEYEGIKVKK